MTRATAFVVTCVRAWTRMYTWRLPPAVREARCEEIESDLWESLHDPERAELPLVHQMLMRLALGITDDLAWRWSHVTVTRFATLRAALVAAVSMLLLFTAVSWLSTNVPALPEPPVQARRLHQVMAAPPPPPPLATTSARAPIFQYGRTSYSVVTDGSSLVPIKQVAPIYPPLAVAARLEGQVVVQARITEHGRVADAEVAPAGILGQSAIDAVQQWEFAGPGNATRRPALLTVRVTFERSQ